MELLPLLSPVWVPLAEGVEVTAWPLRLTDGSLLLGVSGEEAEAYAAAVGGELVSAAEEDACVLAAAQVLRPITHPLGHSPGPAAQSLLVLAQLQEAGGCAEEAILCGACKMWTRDQWMPGEGRRVRPGRAVTYGWHVPESECAWIQLSPDEPPAFRWKRERVRVYPCAAPGFRVVQGLSDFHTREDRACRYEQGVRARRAAP